MNPPEVSVLRTPNESAAVELAGSLGLPLVEMRPAGGVALIGAGELLAAECPTHRGGSYRVAVDFAAGPEARRWRGKPSSKLPLARAIGRGRGIETVIDATAGLGRDAFALAWLGCNVLACERSPVVAALLADGLRRAAAHPDLREVAARVALHHGDARKAITESPPVDAIYLDPMVPHAGKGAAVKKEIRLLQQLLGEDRDAADLLALACEHARRVVVKRPRRAPPLARPDVQINSTRTRWDVYLRCPDQRRHFRDGGP